jgi:serine kinase of HPr protein (carbohydrate metabolism regulator)
MSAPRANGNGERPAMTRSTVQPADRVDLHGTAVAVEGQGLLLRGGSGSGKSDLALRLVDGGARLVADDRVRIERRGDILWVMVPPGIPDALRHKIEIRGFGIASLPGLAEAPLALVVDLEPGLSLERLPAAQNCHYLGLSLPLIALDPFAVSAAAKLRLAVKLGPGSIIPPP